MLVTVDMNEIILCLKHIRTSVNRWNKERGRQEYLTFVDRFM
jgi:hypothetical protein